MEKRGWCKPREWGKRVRQRGWKGSGWALRRLERREGRRAAAMASQAADGSEERGVARRGKAAKKGRIVATSGSGRGNPSPRGLPSGVSLEVLPFGRDKNAALPSLVAT